MGKKIALYGGSFDPVHLGHIAVIKQILNESFIDSVYVIPSGVHPFKEETLFTFAERTKMLEVATSDLNRVIISTMDEKTSEKSYTINLINAFKEEHPEDELYFVIGEDLVTQLRSWKEYQSLFNLVTFLVISRETEDREKWETLEYLKLLKFIKMDLISISSSELREKIKKNEDISFFVPVEIIPLIQGFIEKDAHE